MRYSVKLVANVTISSNQGNYQMHRKFVRKNSSHLGTVIYNSVMTRISPGGRDGKGDSGGTNLVDIKMQSPRTRNL